MSAPNPGGYREAAARSLRHSPEVRESVGSATRTFDAHRTRAGVHADGLNKFWWMYAPFDVPTLIGRPLEVTLTKDSGEAGLLYLIRQHLGLAPAKGDPRLAGVSAWIDAQFAEGRATGIEWEEVEARVRAALADVPRGTSTSYTPPCASGSITSIASALTTRGGPSASPAGAGSSGGT